MEFVIALLVGIGLAAACGFRVFLPLFGLSLAAYFAGIKLSPELAWLASPAALTALAVATVLEIGAYYIPLVDNLLDSITSPAAVIAGTLATAAMLGGLDDPMLKWGLALIAGGGAAGIVQAGTVTARALSAGTTAGLGNPLVSTFEWLGALITTVLALLAPVLVLIGLILLAWGLLRRRRKKAAT